MLDQVLGPACRYVLSLLNRLARSERDLTSIELPIIPNGKRKDCSMRHISGMSHLGRYRHLGLLDPINRHIILLSSGLVLEQGLKAATVRSEVVSMVAS